MTEVDAPVAEAAPIELESVTISDDNNSSNPRDLANALLDYRRKRDAAEAPKEAAEPEPESSEEENAAPADEATGEPTETTEPEEELPPIEPPRSWTKEQKAEFSNLPRVAQEVIAQREQDRESALRRGQNELAEQRKEAESLRAKLNEALQQYEQATNSALQAVQQATAGEFVDIKTPEDISKLAAEDPLRFTRYQAHLMNVQQIERAAHMAQEQRSAQFKAQWAEFAAKEDAKFLERTPELADKEKASKIADASVSMLRDVGFTDTDLSKLWNGEASVSLRDARVQEIIRDAARYRQAQTSAPKKVAAKPVPQVQKPGVARPKGADREAEFKTLEQKLERSGSVKDALELVIARRSARQ